MIPTGCAHCRAIWGTPHHEGCPCIPIAPRPTTQARTQAATRERSDVLNDVAELIERNEWHANHIKVQAATITRLVRTLEEIKALCVKERTR